MKLKTNGLNIVEEITLPDKVVFIGKNGEGKTTLLDAIKHSIEGSVIGGEKLSKYGAKTIAKSDKDGKVFDLAALGNMKGPARAEYLFQLLGAKVEPEEQYQAISNCYEPHNLLDADLILRCKDIDSAIMTANKCKNEADAGSRALRGALKTPDISKGEAEKQLGFAKAELGDATEDKHGGLVAEINGVKEKLGKFADSDPIEISNRVERLRSSLQEIDDKLGFAQDSSASRAADYRVAKLATTKASNSLDCANCPTCTQVIPEALKELFKANEAKAKVNEAEAKAKAEKAKKAVTDLQSEKNTLAASIKMGAAIEKNLSQLIDLRAAIAQTPKGGKSKAEIVELEGVISELEGIIRAHDVAVSNSASAEKLKGKASRYRKVESALKTLKGSVANRAGFPDEVQSILKKVLGWSLEFGKIGNKSDIIVNMGDSKRTVAQISAGEWQIVAAAFGCVEPDAVVLVEAAEIDNDKYALLQKLLSNHKGNVYIADCHGRNPEGWAEVKPNGERALL